MRLEADAVEGLLLGKELLADGEERLGLGVDALDVVVVNVELDVGRGSVRVVELRSAGTRVDFELTAMPM